MRRITQGKQLYRVNTVVNNNNLLTLETLHSAGTFELERVQPAVVFRAGQPGFACDDWPCRCAIGEIRGGHGNRNGTGGRNGLGPMTITAS